MAPRSVASKKRSGCLEPARSMATCASARLPGARKEIGWKGSSCCSGAICGLPMEMCVKGWLEVFSNCMRTRHALGGGATPDCAVGHSRAASRM